MEIDHFEKDRGIISMKKIKIGLITLLFILVLDNCVSSKEFTGDLKSIGNDLVIVGSFELVPPLKEGEQYFVATTPNVEALKNDMYFVVDQEICQDGGLNLSNAGRYANIELGEAFCIRQKAGDRIFISGIFMFWEQKRTHMEYLSFPGPFEFQVPAGARFIYVGNIRFHRDIYNAITKIEIADEYEKAKSGLEKKFGWKIEMQKTRLTVPK
jgi:hypothetical protein